MQGIDVPFPLKDIPLKPELTGQIKVEEIITQTIAALCGYDGEARRLLKCSLGGSLHVVSPPACCFTNKASSTGGENITFGNIPTSEVLILANSNNSGDVWVNVSTNAGVDTGWPLDAGDMLNISINNMAELKLHIVTSGDKVSIIRTV